jgi:hypothetical protein
MTIIGWEQQPRYNESTHNLEWAIRGESEGSPIINYNTRLLGRGGVVEVTLVTDPSTLSETLPKFKTMLAGFDFNQGQRYAEFRQGDKIAEYGDGLDCRRHHSCPGQKRRVQMVMESDHRLRHCRQCFHKEDHRIHKEFFFTR